MTRAGILGELAAAASAQIKGEPIILRPGIGSLFKLYHYIVIITFGQMRLANQRIAFPHELDLRFAVLRVGDDRRALIGHGDRF